MLAASAALVIVAPARALESATVVLVAPVGDAFEARMRAELESMGFDVQVQGSLAGERSLHLDVEAHRLELGAHAGLERVAHRRDEDHRRRLEGARRRHDHQRRGRGEHRRCPRPPPGPRPPGSRADHGVTRLDASAECAP